MIYGMGDLARNMIGISARKNHVSLDIDVPCSHNPAEEISGSKELRKDEFWALRDVSLDLKRGEAIGIIGQNGSGKSTLLRILNGIYPPDHGYVAIRGRMGALIAVGAGFHPHMTGRENIYLNGVILGMSRKEIDARFDAIVDFADIDNFLDAPVATYSSGMNIRLGFAIAVHAQTEILLADEVLAVGDLQFMLKCYRKMGDYRSSGGAIILVSHSMQLVRNTCSNVLWIDKGNVIAYGEAQHVCDKFEAFMMEKDDSKRAKKDPESSIIHHDPNVRITKVSFIGPDGVDSHDHAWGQPLVIRVQYDCKRVVHDPVFTISLFNPENIQVVSNFSIFDAFRVALIEGSGYVDFRMEKMTLRPTEYRCGITFAEKGDINNIIEWHDKSYSFVIVSTGRVSYGIFDPLPQWSVVKLS